MPQVPEPRRMKTLSEQLQEIANANLTEAARTGFAEIDRRAEQAKNKIREAGIVGVDDVVESFATLVKRKAIELATGRKQPE
jgi:TRAP-type C4-dicarboxylate transport system substrate-binding protein